MIIHDEPLLASYRLPGPCEYCGRRCEVREAAHLWARGHGGGGRLDIRINLAGLGGPFLCACHHRLHQGELEPFVLLAVVAARENVGVRDIEAAIREFRRLDKGAPVPAHLAGFLSPTAVVNPPRKRKPKAPRCACGRQKPRGFPRCRRCYRGRAG